MDLKLSKNQVQEFMNNPVWVQIKSDLSEAISDGLVQLQQVDPKESTEIATIQGGLRRIAEFIKLPEGYLEELKEDEELD